MRNDEPMLQDEHSEVPVRPRNYSFEALAEVTHSDWDAARGELNVALKSIRAQSEIADDYLLADEIHERARMYRKVMGEDVLLTPTALAKHWLRVSEVSRKPHGVNLSAEKWEPLPTKLQKVPEWVFVWYWARRRSPPEARSFPQQDGYADPAQMMSMPEYEALEAEWIESGKPRFDPKALA